MSSSPTRAEQAQRWYLNDRPIDSVDSDRLGSVSVAKTIVRAIESLDPPLHDRFVGRIRKRKVIGHPPSVVDARQFPLSIR